MSRKTGQTAKRITYDVERVAFHRCGPRCTSRTLRLVIVQDKVGGIRAAALTCPSCGWVESGALTSQLDPSRDDVLVETVPHAPGGAEVSREC